jgi:hypothetical protein
MECECKIHYATNDQQSVNDYISYCDKHAAADVMLDALKAADDAINPKDKRISLHEWHGRLKLTTSKILNAIALAEKGKTNG